MEEELGGAGGPGPLGQPPEEGNPPSGEASKRAGSEPETGLLPVYGPPALEATIDSALPAVIEFVPAKSVRRQRLWVLGSLLSGIGIGATGVFLLTAGHGAAKLPALPQVLGPTVLGGLATPEALRSEQPPAPVGPAASPNGFRITRMMSSPAVATQPFPSQSPAPTEAPSPGPGPTATPTPTPSQSPSASPFPSPSPSPSLSPSPSPSPSPSVLLSLQWPAALG